MDGVGPIPAPTSASMLAVARGIVSAHQAEDVVQDVSLRFYAAPQRFDPGRGSLASYLMMATRSRAIDLVRSEAGRAHREIASAGALFFPPASVECLVEDREQADQVVAAMKLLPAAEREAIALAYFSGLSYCAVAEHLGLPEGTVKSRIRSGLARLRQILDALDQET